MRKTTDSDWTSNSFGTIIGTFLICCALLAFEVSTVRTINFSIGPSYIFIAISLAMLGLTAAGSLLSLFDLSAIKVRREFVLAGLCVAIAVLLILCQVFVAASKDALNAQVRQAGEAGGLGQIVGVLMMNGTQEALRIGLFLTLPYFLFGSLLSFLFATTRTREYALLYAVDLLGAAVGCVLVVAVMQLTSYPVSVTIPAVCALLAGAAYVYTAKRLVSLAVIGLVIALSALTQNVEYRVLIEPKADPNYLVRDYAMQSQQSERWTSWNSYTRVAVVENEASLGKRAVLSIANGDGMAFLHPYDPNRQSPFVHHPVMPALLAGTPESALVVFAGAGADMMALREHGTEQIVGIEINEKIVEAGLALPAYRLAEFLKLDGVSLNIDEARSFLERDKDHYDLVLVSWSGASAVYYLGGLGGTAQYLYTFEGLSAILNRLNTNGRAVILEGNKVDMLSGLRRYATEHNLSHPDRMAILLRSSEAFGSDVSRWNGNWDDNPLLIKLDGWTEAEVVDIQSKASAQNFDILYAPGLETSPGFDVYERMLTTDDVEAELASISEQEGSRFGIATDDRPFYLDHFQTSRYFTSEFWLGFGRNFETVSDIFRFQQVLVVCVISVAAFLLSLAPLALNRRKVASRWRSATFLSYFMLLGAGFMFIEIGLIQRLSILFGNPGLTIAIVLCIIILTTGLGSLMSNWSFSRGLTIKSASLTVVAFAIAAAVFVPSIVNTSVGASLSIKVAIAIALITPGGLIMGHLFPQGMAMAGQEDKSLTSWAWAINGAMSATVAGVAPLVAQATGFAMLFYIGAVMYAGVYFLPLVKLKK